MDTKQAKHRILFTGSTSFLGTKFFELYGSNFKILGLARGNASNPVDLLDFAAVRKSFLDFQPDVVIHTAADVGRDSSTSASIIKTNPAMTKNLVELSKANNIPFIFTSTEAVYGGKEQGGYSETDGYQPRSPYGESKVQSEKILMSSGLPYLITRGHRYVGINKNYHRPKQFPDALNVLLSDQEVHLDSQKLFTPTLINDICDVFVHYISNDIDQQIIMNLGVDKATTFFDFMSDVADTIHIDRKLLKPDGLEAGWPGNSTLSVKKLLELGYPYFTYRQLLKTIKSELV